MQVKVLGAHTDPVPAPDVTVPVAPPVTTSPGTPVVTPQPNTDVGSKMLSSTAPTNGPSLHPGIKNVMQCALFVTELNQWFTSQADNGTNGSRTPYENQVISRLNSAGTLIDSMTLNNGGHGTSIGVEVVNGVTYIYTTYQANANYDSSVNDLVRFPYAPGTFDRANISGLTVMPKLDAGYDNVQFDWFNDSMVVRNSSGTRDSYIRRRISEWKNGIDVIYGRINLQQAPPTLQGFCTMNDCLFRFIGAANGEKLTPKDLTYIEQYSWNSGQLLDKVDYTSLGKTSTGVYPGNTHEPESCTMYREADGTGTITFTITLDVYPNHQWKVYKLAKLGSVVTVYTGTADEANQNVTQSTLG